MLACGSSASGGTPPGGSSPGATQSASGSGKAAEFHVVVSGGPAPGTFDVTTATPCQYSVAQKIWNAGYAGDITASTGLAVISFSVDASNNPALITVGLMSNGTNGYQYSVSTIVPAGAPGSSGTVTVRGDANSGATFTFQSKTGDGHEVDGTVKCNQTTKL
jgi:hypothetical protein